MKYLVFLVTMTVAAFAHADNFIGKIVPPYSEGFNDLSGACVTDTDEDDGTCKYSINILAKNNEKIAILAQRSLRKSQDDPNTWVVTDQLAYPEVQEGYYLTIGACMFNGKFDDAIVAVVKDAMAEDLQSYFWARRVDLKTGKFTIINPEKVNCFNEGFGV